MLSYELSMELYGAFQRNPVRTSIYVASVIIAVIGLRLLSKKYETDKKS